MSGQQGENNGLRVLCRNLSEGGAREITNAMVYAALEIGGAEPEKARVRSRLSSLLRRGELVRTGAGRYRYNAKAAPRRDGESYRRIWRAIRAAQPGFGYRDIALVTRVSYTQTREYMLWLLDSGFIALAGRKGNTRRFRATLEAREHRETPYPPIGITDPYESEKAAVCRLVGLFMRDDPAREIVQSKIVKECGIILQRFDKNEEAP